MGRPIVFLTDFGLDDEFTGICHGVIARLAPGVRVIDLTHGIPPQDVLRGAVVLADAVRFMPADAVFLAVVDPGVGGSRRAVAVAAGSGGLLVGPDNGLLSLAWSEMGDPIRAVALDAGATPSRTFHGRDLFAPAAARLASGAQLDELGSPVDPSSLIRLAVPEALVGEGSIRAEVLGIDRFGNVQLTARGHSLERAGLAGARAVVVRTVWQALPLPVVTSFGDVAEGELALLIDARDRLAVVRNGGNAATTIRVGLGDQVAVEWAGG